MRFRATLLILTLLYMFSTEPANALTCMDLDGAYVLSQESPPVYLGFFGNAYASESIMYEYGTYGSDYSSLSVRNAYGTYGSPYSSYSANNDYASTPPKVFKNGQLIAYLTTNTYTYGGVSLAEIDVACTFYSSSPAIDRSQCPVLDGAYVFSQESTPVYLGFFGNAYASESIMYEYGTYGSDYSSLSVRNAYGTYGSEYSSYSANSDYTSTPPKVYKNGQFITYLTTNTSILPRVSLPEIDFACTFYSSSPAINLNQPPSPPALIIASDGLYGKITVSWVSVGGATSYFVYYAESLTGTKYLFGSTTATSIDIVDSVPDHVYYFWVSAANAYGQGVLSNPDSGYAKSAQTVSYALIINRLGNDQGTVLSSPEGIKCGSICQYSFSDGTVVTLTAQAAQGVTFIGWSGEGCSGKGTCTVTMDAAKSVTATFERANTTNKGLPWLPLLLDD